jgi:dCTP deaminase
MTVLSHQTIKALCGDEHGLVWPLDSNNIRSASYDLRLGPEFYRASSFSRKGLSKTPRIDRLVDADDKRILVLYPNDIVLVRTQEDVHMPKWLVGHLTLKLDLLLNGIVIAPQSQIDAGYNGPLFVLLHNLSARDTPIQLGDPILRLEFEKLDYPTDQPYKGKIKPDFTLAKVINQPLAGALAHTNREFQRLQRKMKTYVYKGAAAIAIGTIAIIMTMLVTMVFGFGQIITPIQKNTDDAQHSAAQTSQAVQRLQAELDASQQELDALRDQVARQVSVTTTLPSGSISTP